MGHKEITREIRKYFEMKSQHTKTNAMQEKHCLEGNVHACIKNKERSQISNLSFQLKKLEKET